MALFKGAFLTLSLSLFLSSILFIAFLLNGSFAMGKDELPSEYPLHVAIETKDETRALSLIKERKFNGNLRAGISPFALAVSLDMPKLAIAIAQSEIDRKASFLQAEFNTYRARASFQSKA